MISATTMFRMLVNMLTCFGIAYAINAINVHVCNFDFTTRALRCNFEQGNDYAPDRLLSGIYTLEISGKFKSASVNNELMPDLNQIKMFSGDLEKTKWVEGCLVENLEAPENVKVLCQLSDSKVSEHAQDN